MKEKSFRWIEPRSGLVNKLLASEFAARAISPDEYMARVVRDGVTVVLFRVPNDMLRMLESADGVVRGRDYVTVPRDRPKRRKPHRPTIEWVVRNRPVFRGMPPKKTSHIIS